MIRFNHRTFVSFIWYLKFIGVPFYFGMPMRTLFGTAMGYCLGRFVKQISKKLGMYASFGFLTFAMLSKLRYISINWKKIDSDVYYLIFSTGEAQMSLLRYLKRTLTHVMPLLCGVGSGFYYALKN